MTNEEKLREALERVVKFASLYEYEEKSITHAKQVLRETEPPKPKHPAVTAWEAYTPPGPWHKKTFLAGYKAGMLGAVNIVYGDGTKDELRQAANEVPTE